MIRSTGWQGEERWFNLVRIQGRQGQYIWTKPYEVKARKPYRVQQQLRHQRDRDFSGDELMPAEWLHLKETKLHIPEDLRKLVGASFACHQRRISDAEDQADLVATRLSAKAANDGLGWSNVQRWLVFSPWALCPAGGAQLATRSPAPHPAPPKVSLDDDGPRQGLFVH